MHQVVNATDGTLTSVTDSNGQTVNYTYDESKRVTGVETTTDGKAYRNAYTYENDRIKTVAHNTTDDTPDVTYTFNYDELGRKTSLIYRTELDYDVRNRLIGFGETVGGVNHKTTYTYDNDNHVTEISFGGNDKVHYTYDNLGRVSNRVVENSTDEGKLASAYEYVEGGYGDGSTTPLVQKINQPQIPFEYTYDSRGNIISEKRGNLTTTYAYDALGQLIRVNDPHENAT